MFLDSIRTGPVGFNTRTTRDLLDHLYLTYGQVTPLDLRENDLSMKKSYNSTMPIESLFKQIHNRQVFATQTYQPYMLNQLVTLGMLL